MFQKILINIILNTAYDRAEQWLRPGNIRTFKEST